MKREIHSESDHCCNCGHDTHENHHHNHTHEHDENHNHDHHHDHGGEFNLKNEIFPLVLILGLYIPGVIFEGQLHNTFYSIGEYLLFIPAYLLSGWSVLKTAGRNIIRGRVFDETFLMTVATLGAIAIHKLPEAVGVMLFYKIGELFQDIAVNRSRNSIKALLEIRPDYANVQIGGELQKVSPETVNIGEIIVVKPGEKIPLDGEIIDGNSQVDTSALTGESVPRTVRIGETVLAGMLNKMGVLTIKVTKLFDESSIAKILNLVQNARSKKAATEKFITKFARYYTPVVVFTSLAVALLPPLFLNGATSAEWVYRGLILLVISCPCGLVISIPLGYFGGIGGAAKRGILVKGSTFLDTLTTVDTVVFDKTGTLTQGVFKVVDIITQNGRNQQELLELAAKIESHSNHPIAQSIREAYQGKIDASSVEDYQEIAGYGISAKVENQLVLAGSDRLLHRENIAHDVCNTEGTVIHLAVNHIYAGYIAIADELKSDAKEAIQALKRIGVRKTVMLTGDNQAIASQIAQQLGIDSYEAELLPEEKVSALEKLLSTTPKHHTVAFVGDGINDAPVIARADVGIAMGGLGSDAAIETADIVIMTDSPAKVAEAIQISRKTRSIVWQNIIFALGIKSIFIGLGIFGIATMWEAVFADVGVALLAIFNATRVMGTGDWGTRGPLWG
ncbi:MULTISPECIES: heavy metal translocating P-type ATPase [unclassified Tolypothrix]|uniref:heavy metal translocating P-type ATPase n=1 Tax=unclassified Tolypothrix TaxID=2649714 RepID=UPI0005EAC40A|nr:MULTISPECIES: heavy metal translocating P-type ATPase [unclassified Tolypothrix]EKF03144.1 cadmium-translocating P-type ATPase [Tolypothrix sp. PCC 7601]MBE9086944.1 cadmium-translocating P-type ATPase [Tolypothrix sp. LEGE 11397]UYD29570.1 cadmium-translocating P-type ATPase [Tolypothrix sp. PCC 7712]UYD34516.1 cadmium-translocating P-type ATPase [Tolypothrix sp. PCC 7601]